MLAWKAAGSSIALTLWPLHNARAVRFREADVQESMSALLTQSRHADVNVAGSAASMLEFFAELV
jgi:hypothetical protein